ncbi:MAG: metallophosphoesterase family protein [Pseudomonadota bacterium]
MKLLLPQILGRVGRRRQEFRARLPEGMVLYAIGDVHGRADLLDRALHAIFADIRETPPPDGRAQLVFLGDYIDRGPHSCQVIETLMEMQRLYGAWLKITFLTGNHEIAMLSFLRNPIEHRSWLRHGGVETLRSYGIHPSPQELTDRLPAIAAALQEAMGNQSEFLRTSLKTSFRCGDFFFSHAGYNPRRSLDEQTIEDLTFGSRSFLLKGNPDLRVRAVHGHYVEPDPVVLPHRIGVDTGAYLHSALTTVRIEDDDLSFFAARAGLPRTLAAPSQSSRDGRLSAA